MNNQPFIFTLCDAGNSRVEGLRSSLHGNLFVLEAYSPGIGNLSKIFSVREFLASSSHLEDDRILIFLDAYDVLCIRYELEHLAAKFRATGKDLIMGAESIFCHHRSQVLPFFLDRYLDQPARYLNSGFVIAYKWAYLRMLNHIADNFADLYMDRHQRSDQRAISTFMVHNSRLGLIDMDIDCRQEFCHTHTYADNPLVLSRIESYFVHVTWLALDVQAKAYRRIRNHFLA
jgi:hypothetical protein